MHFNGFFSIRRLIGAGIATGVIVPAGLLLKTAQRKETAFKGVGSA